MYIFITVVIFLLLMALIKLLGGRYTFFIFGLIILVTIQLVLSAFIIDILVRLNF
jgi:hypothetical protein